MADKSQTNPNGGARSDAKRALRSRQWFDNPDNPGMTALYLERYLNDGLTLAELASGKPIIGIAQTGSDLSPCNRHHLDLAPRVRAGLRPLAVQSPPPRSRPPGARGHPHRRRHRVRIPVPSDPGDGQAADRGARP